MAGRRRAVCVACNRTPERSFVCSKVHGVDLLPHRHGSLRWFSLAGLSALIACVLLFTVCVRASESPVLISGTGKETVKKQQKKKKPRRCEDKRCSGTSENSGCSRAPSRGTTNGVEPHDGLWQVLSQPRLRSPINLRTTYVKLLSTYGLERARCGTIQRFRSMRVFLKRVNLTESMQLCIR